MTVSILMGDVFERMSELPDDHFSCALSSPPYWGLRSYLDGEHPDKPKEIGCEPTLGEHLDVMVRFCREVRRVLRPDGVFWLNYGDCYATSPNGRSAADTKALGTDDRTFRDKPFSTVGPIYAPDPRSMDRVGCNSTLSGRQHDHTQGRVVAGGMLKPKDLCLIPQRLAIALQEDGWWVRSLLPWVKRNGMPESINDRPASSVEYVIMLTKSARYAYDAEAVRRIAVGETEHDLTGTGYSAPGQQRQRGNRPRSDKQAQTASAKIGSTGRTMAGFNARWDAAEDAGAIRTGRNFRNTDLFFDSLEPPFGLIHSADGIPIAIDICPQGFKEAHFATFPEAFASQLLRAGNPNKGPVLDPFGGAGTVGLVAERLGMDSTLIELNPESVDIADRRIRAGLGRVSGPAASKDAGLPLFDLDPNEAA